MIPKYAFHVLALCCLALPSSAAAEDQFLTLKLPHGITVDAPASWVGFSPAAKAQIAAATQAAVDLSGIDFDRSKFKNLLHIRQPLTSSYASLILSVGFGERASQAELRSLSRSDLAEFDQEAKKSVETMTKQMNLQLLEWLGTSTAEINGNAFLVSKYRRSSPTPNQTAYIETYQYQNVTRSVNFTIEYRERDKVLWDVICRRCLNSLRIQ